MFVDELLARSVRQRPEATALVAGEGSWTYEELGRRVGRLAQALVERGVRPGDRVAVDLANLPEAVVGIWGTLAAGGAFVCLDASSPGQRFAELLEDFRPKVLLTRGERLAGSDVEWRADHLLTLGGDGSGRGESLEDVLEGDDRDEAWPRVERDDPEVVLANLVYTSGSTGRPKGVVMTHRSMGAAIHAITTYLCSERSDVTLCVLPLSFDYGLYQVLMAGAVGSSLVLEPGFGYAGQLLQTLRDRKITTLPEVPTMVAMLLRLRSFRSDNLPHLRTFTNTGAALPEPHVRELRRRFPAARIFLMYGLTECKRVSYLPPEEVDRFPRSVGVPMPGCEVAVVDSEGRRLPAKTIGELVVRGPNLMTGYWERPEETAAVLRGGPWRGEQCLYTGDLFETDERGYLYFVARRDDVLKSRGQKVAPVEIEQVLHGFAGVAEAAVVGIEDPMRGNRLGAAVVPEPGVELRIGELKEHCARRLEAFKVPHEFVLLEQLPRGARGKVDRAALRGAMSRSPTVATDQPVPEKEVSR